MAPAPAPFLLAALAVAGALAGCVSAPDAHADAAELPAAAGTRPGVVVATDFGNLTLVLFEDRMPATTANFRSFADAGFYEGRVWERVVDNFVIQSEDRDGDPADTIPLETHPDVHFAAGVLGMARDVEEDSATHVFFVTEYPQPHLDRREGATLVVGTYAGFGQLVDGFDVLRRIAASPTRAPPEQERPVDDVRILNVTAVDVPVPEDFDLLYPRQVAGRVSAPPYRVSLEHDRVLREGVPVTRFAFFVENQSDRTADTGLSLEMTVTGADGYRESVALAPDPDDGNVHHAAGYAFPAEGAYRVTVALSPLPLAPQATFTVRVASSPAPGASA